MLSIRMMFFRYEWIGTVKMYRIGDNKVEPSSTMADIDGPKVYPTKKTKAAIKSILSSQRPSLMTLTCLVLGSRRAKIKKWKMTNANMSRDVLRWAMQLDWYLA